MRKFVPALLGAIVMAAPLHAQAAVGLEGGYVSANISASGGSSTFTTDSRSGFAAGIFVDGMLSQNVALGPEAMYIEKGFQETGPFAGTFKVNYIEVPVLLHLMAGNHGTKFFVLGGPAVAFRISCSVDATSGGTSVSADCGSGTDNDIKSTDFTAMFGAGVMVGDLSLSGRYDLGLTNLNNSSSNTDVTYKSHTLLIMAGLRLGR